MGTGTATSKPTRSRAGTNGLRASRDLTLATLATMQRDQLDELFTSSAAGPTPSGVADGVAIVAPGTLLAPSLQPLLHFAWRGKVFYPERQDLLNRITPFNVLMARAHVFRDVSWSDGKEAIVLDYSIAALPFRPVRDEIRQVAPGLYLGVVYWVGRKSIDFALQFR